MAAKPRNFGLDLMRSIAILIVVLSHYAPNSPLAVGGLLGVEMFFVLSGFLIGGILFKTIEKDGISQATLLVFWKRRWMRTIPNYAFFLVLCTIETSILGAISWKVWLLYPVFLQNFAWPCFPFFEISWSLAVEEWFYLLFPIGVFATASWLKGRLSRKQVELYCAIGFLVIPMLLRYIYSQQHETDVVRKIVLCRLDAMMYGVLLAWLKLNATSAWNALSGYWLLIPSIIGLGIGAQMCRVSQQPLISMVWSFSVIPFASMLMIAPLHRLTKIPKLAKILATYVSKVSYSAYLLHMPLLVFSINLLENEDWNTATKALWRCLLVMAVFLLSFITYRFIELPFLRLRDKAPSHPKIKIAE